MLSKHLIINYLLKNDKTRYEQILKLKIENPTEYQKQIEIIHYEIQNKQIDPQYYTTVINTDELNVDTKTDGIKYVSNNINHQTLKKYSAKALEEHNTLNVFVGNEFSAKGKFINEIKQYKQEIKIAYIGERTHPTGETTTQIYFLDDKPDKRKLRIIKELISSFWVYQFESENKEYIVLSEERIKLESYTIEGSLIRLGDDFQIGQSRTIKINLPIILLNNTHKLIQTYKTKQELINKCKEIGLNHKKYFNWLFSIDGKTYNHPDYFQYLVSSVLLSTPTPYPLHLMVIAKPGSGKSTMEECIIDKYDENIGIIEGSCSTMKALIPSFKGSLPDPGALIKSNKLCVIDEFLRILMRTHKDDREEQLASLNPLLEHKDRIVKSGNGEIHIHPTMQCISVTNPIWGTKTMYQLCDRLDNSHLSRWLIWYQDLDHINYVQSGKGLEDCIFDMDKGVWNSMLIFLHSFTSVFDVSRLDVIFVEGLGLLGEDNDVNVLQKVRDVYCARYKHHIRCLMDGVVKTRCLCTGDVGFVAVERDYELVRVLWFRMLVTWGLHLEGLGFGVVGFDFYDCD